MSAGYDVVPELASDAPVSNRSSFCSDRERISRVSIGVGCFVACVLCLALVLSMSVRSSSSPPSFGVPQRFSRLSVSSDSPLCSSRCLSSLLPLSPSSADLSICVALCLGLVHPHSSGLGGGAVCLIRSPNGSTQVLDARERAPLSSHAHMFLNTSSTIGAMSVATPGELKGLWELHQRHGHVEWSKVLDVVIQLANEGFNADQALVTAAKQTKFQMGSELERLYGQLEVGQLVKRPDLGVTLNALKNGPDVFYRGEIGRNIIETLKRGGGVMNATDLVEYNVRWSQPLTTWISGLKVTTAGGAYGGPVLIQALNTLEPMMVGQMEPQYHYVVEALKFAYSNRQALGDPAWEPQVEETVIPTMTSKEHAAWLRSKIKSNATFPPPYYSDIVNITQPSEAHGTTHFTVVDVQNGLAIGCTSTVNLLFGSLVMTPDGILLNDQMDDFSSPDRSNAFGYPPSPANYIAPGKRPLSSMTPTMIEQDTKLLFSVGGSGGSRIITGVLQTILQFILWQKNVLDSVSLPRLHDQLLPIGVNLESAFDQSTAALLKQLGHNVTYKPSDWVDAVVQAIAVTPDGSLEAACDWRKEGNPNVKCMCAGV